MPYLKNVIGINSQIFFICHRYLKDIKNKNKRKYDYNVVINVMYTYTVTLVCRM